MKVRVQCDSVEQKLTGHNNDQEYVYSFEPELVLGIQLERISGGFSFHSRDAHLFSVGARYELEIH